MEIDPSLEESACDNNIQKTNTSENDKSKNIKDTEKLLKYIKKLKKIIRKQRIVMDDLNKKLIKLQIGKDVSNKNTQTDGFDSDNQDVKEYWKSSTSTIKEMVEDVAGRVVSQTGFVYESSSGLYYDYNTGYYYNAELGLYYDGTNGIYYYYDKDANRFQFHSKVECSTKRVENVSLLEENKTSPSGSPKITKKLDKKKKKKKNRGTLEEGECSETDSETEADVEMDDGGDESTKEATENCSVVITKEPVIDEAFKAWPPCMRVIIQETSTEDLNVGTLFIVTCIGGTLGREGEHAILIPDINISKYHAKFSFENRNEQKEDGDYVLVDLGSRNGTFLDGARLSPALQESGAHTISHGSVIRVGGTALLCHIHAGRETCDNCEPGLLLPPKDTKVDVIRSQKIKDKHKKELKILKKKFGFHCNDSEMIRASTVAAGYEDKAQKRRQTVGSSSDSFKTETASISEPIGNKNKGFKMLSKMGWSKGDALGKESTSGITEPIMVLERDLTDKVGLGYESLKKPQQLADDLLFKRKQEIWKKTKQRLKDIS